MYEQQVLLQPRDSARSLQRGCFEELDLEDTSRVSGIWSKKIVMQNGACARLTYEARDRCIRQQTPGNKGNKQMSNLRYRRCDCWTFLHIDCNQLCFMHSSYNRSMMKSNKSFQNSLYRLIFWEWNPLRISAVKN